MLGEKFTENSNYSQFFSFEVLNYFDSICTDENYEWIVKYFKTLMTEENKTAEKFNMHHIRPCCTFKDKNHKNRKETQKLGDEFKGNVIKVSIYNHLLGHYYLWKIFNNYDLKTSFQRMCGTYLQNDNINNLDEEKLKFIAKLQEECFKKNLTREEINEKNKENYKNHREEKLKYSANYRKINHDEILKKQRKYREENHDEILNRDRKYRKNNHDAIKRRMQKYRKDNYDKIHKQDEIWRKNNKDKIAKSDKKYQSKPCFDPIRHNKCTLTALQKRISRNKEEYKNIIATDYIIRNSLYEFYYDFILKIKQIFIIIFKTIHNYLFRQKVPTVI